MCTFDPIRHLRETIDHGSQILAKDLRAIPEEKVGSNWGGCTRSPLQFVAECAMLNGTLAAYIETGVFTHAPREESMAFQNSFKATAPLVQYLEEQTQKLLKALEGMNPDTLWETDQPFGMPMTKFQIIGLAANHMSYHDGQLNYIQSMLGDDQVHW